MNCVIAGYALKLKRGLATKLKSKMTETEWLDFKKDVEYMGKVACTSPQLTFDGDHLIIVRLDITNYACNSSFGVCMDVWMETARRDMIDYANKKGYPISSSCLGFKYFFMHWDSKLTKRPIIFDWEL